MPPKNAPSKKAEQKKKEKIIEDKTFGLKNKKGAKTQKYVQQVTNQASESRDMKFGRSLENSLFCHRSFLSLLA